MSTGKAMTYKATQPHADESNIVKDPDQWVTGDEPMTGAQRGDLKTFSEQANVPLDDGLSEGEASKRIDELQAKTGRGKPSSAMRLGERGGSANPTGGEYSWNR
jgi:Protein of unknown function (DUF3072)